MRRPHHLRPSLAAHDNFAIVGSVMREARNRQTGRTAHRARKLDHSSRILSRVGKAGNVVADWLMDSWRESGSDRMSAGQRRLLNAACTDLAEQLPWHEGIRLSKDDYRHMIAGTLLGWKFMLGIDVGDGNSGFITLGGSSLKLTKSQATDAITIMFLIGDDPSSQDLKSPPVKWSQTICLARGIGPDER